MELVFEHDQAQLWYDSEFRILKAIWFGEVSEEAFSGLVLKGAEILDKLDAAHIIFDRRKLDVFSAEARVWFKYDFMRKDGEGRKLIKRVRKMAAIKGASVIGHITSTVAAKLLLLFNPKLDYKVFNNDRIAEGWVMALPKLGDMNMAASQNSSRPKKSFYSWLFRRA